MIAKDKLKRGRSFGLASVMLRVSTWRSVYAGFLESEFACVGVCVVYVLLSLINDKNENNVKALVVQIYRRRSNKQKKRAVEEIRDLSQLRTGGGARRRDTDPRMRCPHTTKSGEISISKVITRNEDSKKWCPPKKKSRSERSFLSLNLLFYFRIVHRQCRGASHQQ
jgi:hypothetical protein